MTKGKRFPTGLSSRVHRTHGSSARALPAHFRRACFAAAHRSACKWNSLATFSSSSLRDMTLQRQSRFAPFYGWFACRFNALGNGPFRGDVRVADKSGPVVGRIMHHPQAPKDQPWFWTITARQIHRQFTIADIQLSRLTTIIESSAKSARRCQKQGPAIIAAVSHCNFQEEPPPQETSERG